MPGIFAAKHKLMLPTQNTLPKNVRQNTARLLQQFLVDSIDLMLQSKQAHWNVRGPNFIALHKLFDEIHEEVETSVDLIAERIAQLGGSAEGTSQSVAKKTSLSEYPVMITSEVDHVRYLSNALAEFGRRLHLGIKQTSEWNDPDTADILTEISRKTSKQLWFVESHTSERRNSQTHQEAA